MAKDRFNTPLNEHQKAEVERYMKAAHAVQSGVKARLGYELRTFLEKREEVQRHLSETYGQDSEQCQAGIEALDNEFIDGSFAGGKHLRTGLDLRAADMRGLATLLIEKGIIDADEYFTAVADAAEAEQAEYERVVSILLEQEVKLA